MFVTQQKMINQPQTYKVISKIKKREGKTTSTQKKKSAVTHKYMDSYLKFGFIKCPDTDQLPRPQCVICATVLGKEEE
jgi:hypothetical protein